MPTLTPERIADLLAPYLAAAGELSSQIIDNKTLTRLSTYLDLLLRWNARTNLTAITAPDEIVQRHFGESLFAARHLANRLQTTPEGPATLLDFGSGAGFPGLPIQLALPDLQVTLAESQGKKAAFLREAVRTLGLPTEVWSARAETMPPTRLFHVVALRAVDRMPVAVPLAATRVLPGGTLAILGGSGFSSESFPSLSGWTTQSIDLPGSTSTRLYLLSAGPEEQVRLSE